MATTEVKSNLVYSKELVNFVAYANACRHIKELLIAAEKTNEVVIIEVWQFPDTRPPEATAKMRLEQDLKG